MDPMFLLICAGVGATLMLAVFALTGDASVGKRLERVGTGTIKDDKKAKPVDRLTAVRQQYEQGHMNRIAFHILPNKEKLRDLIQQTGKNITLGQYVGWMIASGFGGYFVFHFIFGFANVTASIIAIGLCVWLPFKILKIMAASRMKKFIAFFPEAIDTMVRGLKSGLPVGESINAVGRESPGPVGEEFRHIAAATHMGRTLDEAMWEVAKRVPLPEYRFLVISMAIQRETGGNLGETLGNLSELLRRRRQLKLKIKAMSSEAKASAMIIGSLPFIMWCLLFLVQRDYAMTLFNDPRGNILLAGGSFWMGMGIMVMKKMISFEI